MKYLVYNILAGAATIALIVAGIIYKRPESLIILFVIIIVTWAMNYVRNH